MSDSFGKKIRECRIKAGLTQEELAERLETQKNYVWQLENKSPARPSGKLLLKIADILEVSPDYLIDDSSLSPSSKHLENAFFRKADGMNLTNDDLSKVLSILDLIKK